MTVPWTHHRVVSQPFADFTWRASRKIAAQRGVDDTNEMAVAVILAALLRRAETGPGTDRVLARTYTAREMTNHLPAELTTPPTQPALPPPPADPELDAEAVEVEMVDGEVVGFGMFDPFADELGACR